MRRLTVSLLALASSAALAQDRQFPSERFEPGVDKEAIINTSWAAVPNHLEWDVGLLMGYSNDPLFTYNVTSQGDPTDRDRAVIENRLAGHLTGSVAFFNWLQIGADIPLLAFQQRDQARAPGNDDGEIGTFGVGDVRLYPKARVLRQRDGGPLDIGFQLPVSLPTGQATDYFGERGFTFTPTLLASREFDLLDGTLRLAGNLGTRFRTEPAVYDENNTLGTELIARAGASYVFYVQEDHPTEVGLSLAMAPQVDGFLEDIPARSPAEVLGEVDYTIFGPFSASLGGAVGIQAGAGGPDFRVFAGLRFAPRSAPDRDGDGIPDRDDKCPNEPETFNGFDDEDGCPDVDDQDGDGIRDADDQCPDIPEDKDGFEDEDGCPDDDHDKDGIPNDDDRKVNAACVEISQEAQTNLARVYELQQAYRAENNRYGALAKIGFTAATTNYTIDVIDFSADRFTAIAKGTGLQAGDAWTITNENKLVNSKSLCVITCIDEPEDKDGFEDADGCPDLDNDNDGIPDTEDKCPLEAEDIDGFEDEDGCPDLDNDGDGFADKKDRCPNEAGPKENQGCPDTDRDGDGVVDRLDNCPDEAGPADNAGCVKKQLVRLQAEKIEILDKVFFKTGQDVIENKSFPLLDNVAEVLNKHPEIAHIRVEGHTDNTGSDATNRDLSDRRAKAVVKYLTNKGVAADRVVGQGYGPERPVADNGTDEGRAANRRVEFVIVHDDEAAAGDAAAPPAAP
jgi:outer membrane protein OmpA-like peptidoglycan-associated protein